MRTENKVDFVNYRLIKLNQKSYNSEPKKVFPVLTAKQIALSMSLCWCSKGSKIRCSITPARTWYLVESNTSFPLESSDACKEEFDTVMMRC